METRSPRTSLFHTASLAYFAKVFEKHVKRDEEARLLHDRPASDNAVFKEVRLTLSAQRYFVDGLANFDVLNSDRAICQGFNPDPTLVGLEPC